MISRQPLKSDDEPIELLHSVELDFRQHAGFAGTASMSVAEVIALRIGTNFESESRKGRAHGG